MLAVMPTELDEQTHMRVLAHAERGDALASTGDYRSAIQAYNEGWSLLPEPKSQWSAATWMLAAIADAAYLGGFLISARQALDFVMTCPGAVGNPFLHLRRGEVLHDQGEVEGAVEELLRAYMGAGAEIFNNEDPKYLAALREHVDLNSHGAED